MGILEDIIDSGNSAGGGFIDFLMRSWWFILIGIGVVVVMMIKGGIG